MCLLCIAEFYVTPMVVEGQDMNPYWITGPAITMSVIASPVQRFDDRNMIFHVFCSLDDKKKKSDFGGSQKT